MTSKPTSSVQDKYSMPQDGMENPLRQAGDMVRQHQSVTRLLFVAFCVTNVVITLTCVSLYAYNGERPITRLQTALEVAHITRSIRHLAQGVWMNAKASALAPDINGSVYFNTRHLNTLNVLGTMYRKLFANELGKQYTTAVPGFMNYSLQLSAADTAMMADALNASSTHQLARQIAHSPELSFIETTWVGTVNQINAMVKADINHEIWESQAVADVVLVFTLVMSAICIAGGILLWFRLRQDAALSRTLVELVGELKQSIQDFGDDTSSPAQEHNTNANTNAKGGPSGAPIVARLIARTKASTYRSAFTSTTSPLTPSTSGPSSSAQPPTAATEPHPCAGGHASPNPGTLSITVKPSRNSSVVAPAPETVYGAHATASQESQVIIGMLERHRKRVRNTLMVFCVCCVVLSSSLTGMSTRILVSLKNEAQEVQDRQEYVFKFKVLRETLQMSSILNTIANDSATWRTSYDDAYVRIVPTIDRLQALFSDEPHQRDHVANAVAMHNQLTLSETQCFSASTTPCSLVYRNSSFDALCVTFLRSMDHVADHVRTDADDLTSWIIVLSKIAFWSCLLLIASMAVLFYVVNRGFKELRYLQVIASAPVSWTMPQILRDAEAFTMLQAFLRANSCEELALFIRACNTFMLTHASNGFVSKAAMMEELRHIETQFVKPGARYEVNLSARSRNQYQEALQSGDPEVAVKQLNELCIEVVYLLEANYYRMFLLSREFVEYVRQKQSSMVTLLDKRAKSHLNVGGKANVSSVNVPAASRVSTSAHNSTPASNTNSHMADS